MSEEQLKTEGSVVVPPIKAILAEKLGMTRVVKSSGEFVPVTVLRAGPCPVLQVKTKANEGYSALQIGFGAAKEKNLSQGVLGHLKKTGTAPVRWIREVLLSSEEGFQAGQQIRVSQFAAGDVVDVSGDNKGKGFAGVVKRHKFKGGPKTHGQSDRHRAPGAIGGSAWPSRVRKGMRMGGHMGACRSTVRDMELVKLDEERAKKLAENNLLLIKGGVPGPNGGFVIVRRTNRLG